MSDSHFLHVLLFIIGVSDPFFLYDMILSSVCILYVIVFNLCAISLFFDESVLLILFAPLAVLIVRSAIESFAVVIIVSGDVFSVC